jgi:hypothetical protein
MRWIGGVIGIPLSCLAVWAMTESATSLLAKYKLATCLPYSGGSRAHERSWNTTLSLRDGSKVTVQGAARPGGGVGVTYDPPGQKYLAARPHDYIYPIDIRVDTQNDILYVAASGLAGGLWEQTWLFAFDLHERKPIARRKIRYQDLPTACSGGSAQ